MISRPDGAPAGPTRESPAAVGLALPGLSCRSVFPTRDPLVSLCAPAIQRYLTEPLPRPHRQ
jgi:hypothetical protein